MVFGELRSKPAHLAQRSRPDRVVRSDAHRRKDCRVAALEYAVKRGLGVKPCARGPALRCVVRADAGRADVADLRIGETTHDFFQIGRAGHVIRVQLRDEVVPVISVVIVKECEVAFLAPCPTRPRLPVVIRPSLSC